MCANDTSDSPGGSGESRVQLHARVSDTAMNEVERYAELHDCPKWEAVDQLLKIGAGSTDVATQVEHMDAKLQRVLEELQAPGIGSEIAEDGIVADGALTAKIDYDSLQWRHSVEISPEEAAFSDPSTVSQTPRSRVPVIRGLMLDMTQDRLSESELLQLIRDTYNCTLPTAETYLSVGEYQSWYPNPGYDITRREGLWSAMKEQMLEAGVQPAHLERKNGIKDYCSDRLTDDNGVKRYVLPVEETYTTEKKLINASIRQIISNMEQILRERPSSGKYKLLVERVFTYGMEHGDLSESDVEETRTRLQETGVELPDKRWWE